MDSRDFQQFSQSNVADSQNTLEHFNSSGIQSQTPTSQQKSPVDGMVPPSFQYQTPNYPPIPSQYQQQFPSQYQQQSEQLQSYQALISEATESLMKQRKQNRKEELKEMIYQHAKGNFDLESLNNLSVSDLIDLGSLIDQKLQEINNRINMLSNTTTTNTTSLPPPPPPPPAEAGSSSQPAEG